MTTAGWVFMIASVSFVWGLMLWSYAKILRAPRADARPSKEPPGDGDHS